MAEKRGASLPAARRTEVEAQSQTDFAPLQPLDPLEFDLNALTEHYDPNLMYVPEEAEGSMLQEFGMSRQITFESRLKP